ncbi:hypothetical protein SAMN05428975_5315 [Mucilaginibacter sp. OK268]|uniref:hypothetical protein n=1 Tax=Mucilaginibacter sp. OK268 TaxID=1881048 RepID=UPI00088E5AD0|nr:hypothetical protein [Mucilaginibacter sp. OK268]SDQ00228.1 hypothetical protein SAMN05428975_5315 [Mucilaginibacter sp. OK268]
MNLNLSKQTLLLFFLLTCAVLTGCKKDAIIVKENKTFREINVPPPTDPRFSNTMVVTLTPNGTGGISLGGDAIYPATYDISGSTLKITDNSTLEKYKLKIVSETELNYNGRILRLEK